MPDFDPTFDPVEFLESQTRALDPEQINEVAKFLVGVFSSYVDPDATIPVSQARWRRYVALAVEAAGG